MKDEDRQSGSMMFIHDIDNIIFEYVSRFWVHSKINMNTEISTERYEILELKKPHKTEATAVHVTNAIINIWKNYPTEFLKGDGCCGLID